MFSLKRITGINHDINEWLNEHPEDYIKTLTSIYLRIRPMADDDTKDINGVWYSANVNNRRFTQEVAELLSYTHGDRAYLYALERVISESSNEEEVALWKSVLTHLEKEK